MRSYVVKILDVFDVMSPYRKSACASRFTRVAIVSKSIMILQWQSETGVYILVASVSDNKTYVFRFGKCDCCAEIGRLRRIDRIHDHVSKSAVLALGCERITSFIGNSRRHNRRRGSITVDNSDHPGRKTAHLVELTVGKDLSTGFSGIDTW